MHILLIGGASEVHPKVKKLGHKMTMLIPMNKLKGRKNLDMYDRIVGIPNSSGIEEWIQVASMIHKLDPFECIGGFNEPTQDIAARVALALGLEFHSLELIELTRQKDKMRQALRSYGLDHTASAVVDSVSGISSFASLHGYPVIIKPVDGRGSLSVSVIRSEREILKSVEWFRRWSPKSKILVEEFLQGPEYSAEAFSEDGVHKIVCVTQKFKNPETFVETGHCLPAPIPQKVTADISSYVMKVLTVLGLKNGPSHTEVIVTKSGPVIVETHARLAGDSIVEMIELTTGVDLDEMWIRQCAGEKVLSKITNVHGRYASIHFVTPDKIGTLDRIERLSDSLAAGVVRVETLQEVGARLEGAYDSFARGAYAIAVGETPTQAIERAKSATDSLRFIVS